MKRFIPFGLACVLILGCSNQQSTPDSTDSAPGDTLRILAYNIHHGEGMDEVVDLERIAALISSLNPDLVALQEVDQSVERTGGVDQAAILGELTGLTPVFGKFMDYQGGEYGMAVLSRWPIVDSENHRLPDGAEPRSSVGVTVRSPETGRELMLLGIHFYRTIEDRLAQSRRVLEILDGIETPVFLAGDFNSVPESLVMDLFENTWTILDKGEDHFSFPSYNADIEIDYIMVRSDDTFEVISHYLLEEPVISDHRPLYAELVWR